MAYAVGMTKVRFPYLYQECSLDGSQRIYNMDHNRCILCTRCVRVCDEVEGAHVWDVRGRGYESRIISDFNQPWGESQTCTDCGKCVDVCPVGALWHKGSVQGKMVKDPAFISDLIAKKKFNKI
jgi:bidirectional [NiFe] hydrogenase diaphorase subunit